MITKESSPYKIFTKNDKVEISGFKYLYFIRFFVILPLNQHMPIYIIDFVLKSNPNTPSADNPMFLRIKGNNTKPVNILAPIVR